MFFKAKSISLTPFIISSISIPTRASGNKPTAENTENLPPTSSGITNVLYPSWSASCLRTPIFLSVVATIFFQWSPFYL